MWHNKVHAQLDSEELPIIMNQTYSKVKKDRVGFEKFEPSARQVHSRTLKQFQLSTGGGCWKLGIQH